MSDDCHQNEGLFPTYKEGIPMTVLVDFLISSETLSFEISQINLEFCSLIRIFAPCYIYK